jgi:hypothetical protein
VAKYSGAAVGRDVISVAKKSGCHATCIFFFKSMLGLQT